MQLLSAFAEAQEKFCNDVPIGFIYKVIDNMYRGHNFCAGKLAQMTINICNGKASGKGVAYDIMDELLSNSIKGG